jgi:hypothetical protein
LPPGSFVCTKTAFVEAAADWLAVKLTPTAIAASARMTLIFIDPPRGRCGVAGSRATSGEAASLAN